MTRVIAWLAGMVAIASLAACERVKNRRTITFNLTIAYTTAAGRGQHTVTNVVRVADKYNYSPGMAGWAHDCAGDVVAIPIPVRGGHVIALTDAQSGSSYDWNSCQIAMLEVEKNEHGARISKWLTPRFVFLPAGKGLKDAVEVDFAELDRYGLGNVALTAERATGSFGPVSPLFGHLGCGGQKPKFQSTSTPPGCESIVVLGLN